MNAKASAIFLPTDLDDEVGLADWAEASMLLAGRKYYSRAAIRKAVARLAVHEDPDVPTDILLQEVSRRRRACSVGYPFAEASGGMELRSTLAAASVAYIFMLMISVSRPYRLEHRYSDTDTLFDELVLDALKRYLGQGAVGVRFGSPASGTRPPNFRASIEWLAEKMKMPLGRGRARPTAGDGGLDVVAWRPFRDNRIGYLVLLAQCTVQLDWFAKAKDLTEDVWRGWIDLGKDPHLVLAVPFVISLAYTKWDELRRTVHTVLDRIRLCELLGVSSLSEGGRMKEWIEGEMFRLAGSD